MKEYGKSNLATHSANNCRFMVRWFYTHTNYFTTKYEKKIIYFFEVERPAKRILNL